MHLLWVWKNLCCCCHHLLQSLAQRERSHQPLRWRESLPGWGVVTPVFGSRLSRAQQAHGAYWNDFKSPYHEDWYRTKALKLVALLSQQAKLKIVGRGCRSDLQKASHNLRRLPASLWQGDAHLPTYPPGSPLGVTLQVCPMFFHRMTTILGRGFLP